MSMKGKKNGCSLDRERDLKRQRAKKNAKHRRLKHDKYSGYKAWDGMVRRTQGR